MPGAIIFRGPSRFDAQPIVIIAVWNKPTAKANRKTGAMVQTYILRDDPDLPPTLANKLGEDFSICGSCPLRGTPTLDPDKKQAEDRPCYVVLGQGPTQVFKALQAGNYPDASTPAARRAIGAGRMVRIGTYGDGAAAPDDVWTDLIHDAAGHTGYSHAHTLDPSTPGANPTRLTSGVNPNPTRLTSGVNPNPALYMTSADNLDAARAAWSRGERTFRVYRLNPLTGDPVQGQAPVPGEEIVCPSLKGVQCIDCGLCAGASIKARSIAIPVHGTGSKYF